MTDGAPTDFDPTSAPHRRRNLLTGEWVLVSPHRARRPWQGEQTETSSPQLSSFEPDCYLCPGNTRANGEINPDYNGPFMFANDFAALMPDTPAPPGDDEVFGQSAARGESKVICFSPDHARTLPQLSRVEVRAVVEACKLASRRLFECYASVQVFENKGTMMGCSSPHPHGQIWATDYVPTEIAKEDIRQADWHARTGVPLLQTVIEREEDARQRIVETNARWLAVVPWWAAWPFETLLIARDPVSRLDELDEEASDLLAEILRRLTARYDNLFATRFPYSMGWHQRPASSATPESWRLHAHFYPPLLRSATVRKFMVGFEMLAEPQRDLTPEQAAQRLRDTSPFLTNDPR